MTKRTNDYDRMVADEDARQEHEYTAIQHCAALGGVLLSPSSGSQIDRLEMASPRKAGFFRSDD